VEALRNAFEAVGIEFTNGDQPGVRLRKKRQRARRETSMPPR
jgi:hypothetical protein